MTRIQFATLMWSRPPGAAHIIKGRDIIEAAGGTATPQALAQLRRLARESVFHYHLPLCSRPGPAGGYYMPATLLDLMECAVRYDGYGCAYNARADALRSSGSESDDWTLPH